MQMKRKKKEDDNSGCIGLSYKERREDLKKLIREIGLWRFPLQRRLAERYGVSQQQISKDLKHIFTTLDLNKVDEIFTEFYFADQKIIIEMRKFLRSGTFDEKVKASMVLIKLQKAFTDLLERYGRKPIVPDKVEVVDSRESWNKIGQDIKEYGDAFQKMDKETREKFRDTLLKRIEKVQNKQDTE